MTPYSDNPLSVCQPAYPTSFLQLKIRLVIAGNPVRLMASLIPMTRLLCTICLLALLRRTLPIKCLIGYGQRGLLRQDGISWPRTCPSATYCWEAVTSDISIIDKLFSFYWDPYYYQFYVRACGGEFGTLPTSPPASQFNVTVPVDIVGKGGQEIMTLRYSCEFDLCSNALRTSSITSVSLALSAIALFTLSF